MHRGDVDNTTMDLHLHLLFYVMIACAIQDFKSKLYHNPCHLILSIKVPINVISYVID